ncbi:hypothetical protein MKK84_21185 [Methylobacterium sp. E-065]|uniref:hypothetical protein n=1 Tax=Methylobacterium sp. E-065 TaxID=2836583 RepID=UPI001FB9E0A8|nr:hypothetical protein [Methylobacterium sp. E-065]MCJ2019917.1 hypothetical protein [Methylobacterium sp. E-065]
MTILTSYWSRPLPPDYVRISVSRGSPRWMKPQPKIPEFAPGQWLYTTPDPEEYRIKYVSQLACVDVGEIVERIDRMAGGRTAVLCCFCKPGVPGGFCHRAWLSVLFAHRANLEVPELGMEADGSGAAHPLLPQEYRWPLEQPSAQARPVQLDLL